MKKLLLVCLTLALLLNCSGALASDLTVQVVGGSQGAINTVSLDDMQLATAYTIDGYAVVKPREIKFVQCFAQFGEQGDYSVFQVSNEWNYYPYTAKQEETNYATVYAHSQSPFIKGSWRYTDASWMDSGDTADFAWLLMDVTNLQKKDVDFTKEVTITAVYQDEYEFVGWIRQIAYDHMEGENGDKGLSRYGYEKEDYPNEIVMNPAMVEPIGMMYTGTYAFGCTLPNYVIEDKNSPLRIEIKLGDNDLTYHIRK